MFIRYLGTKYQTRVGSYNYNIELEKETNEHKKLKIEHPFPLDKSKFEVFKREHFGIK